ncbi:MAG: AraC family transcriptional regulator [Ruminococcaceae bacterium]|nr:AraC family transcriptional regulator [Oscillospiraceae bacterium]
MEQSFELRNLIYENPSNDRFVLHVHEKYEIYMFLEGEARFIVEADTYPLCHGDVIIVRKNQMHRAYQMSQKRYQSLVLWVSPSFFVQNDCAEYETHFMQPELMGSKIDAETVRSSGLYDAMMRLRKYSNRCTDPDQPVVRGIVLEILYLLRNINAYSDAEQGNERLKNIFSYINENFTGQITLDSIAENCFISKYHLCHIFPAVTGLTVHRYITSKRLDYARSLIQEGATLSQAAEAAGFATYSSFYRAYLAEHGHSPIQDK